MTTKIEKNRTAKLKPVYLRCSSDRFLLDRSVEQLKKGYFLGEDFGLNVNEFYASEASINEIVNSCQTLSFFPEKRLVIVWEAEKINPAEFDKLVDYTKNPSENTVLFLAAHFQKRDNESADAFKRRRSRLLKVFEGKAEIKELAVPKKGEFPDWVKKEFLERGKVVSISAAKYLVDRVGFDLYALTNEIEKTCLYFNDRKGLEVEDISMLISQSVAGNIYDLVDAVSIRDLPLTLDLFGHFLQRDDEASRLLYALIRQFRSLLKAKVLLGKGVNGSELTKQLGVQQWLVQKYRDQSQKFTLDELKQALVYLLEADVSIKTGEKTPKAAVESLVIKIVKS